MSFSFLVCKKTCLGPTYGSFINKVLILNPANANAEYMDNYLAYSTEKKVIGLIKLPLEGNPNHTMGVTLILNFFYFSKVLLPILAKSVTSPPLPMANSYSQVEIML